MQGGELNQSLERLIEAQYSQTKDIAAMQATLRQWEGSIERFWESHWPDLKGDIADLRDEVHDLREALSGMKTKVEVVKVKTSHWTGFAALAGTLVLMIRDIYQTFSSH